MHQSHDSSRRTHAKQMLRVSFFSFHTFLLYMLIIHVCDLNVTKCFEKRAILFFFIEKKERSVFETFIQNNIIKRRTILFIYSCKKRSSGLLFSLLSRYFLILKLLTSYTCSSINTTDCSQVFYHLND